MSTMTFQVIFSYFYLPWSFITGSADGGEWPYGCIMDICIMYSDVGITIWKSMENEAFASNKSNHELWLARPINRFNIVPIEPYTAQLYGNVFLFHLYGSLQWKMNKIRYCEVKPPRRYIFRRRTRHDDTYSVQCSVCHCATVPLHVPLCQVVCTIWASYSNLG